MKSQFYGKSELAMMYFPNSSNPRVAMNRLTNNIKRNKELVAELKKCGSSKKAKFYTPKEVALIQYYLGDV